MLQNYDPIIQALIASLFTWGVTALGAALGKFFANILNIFLVFVLPSNSRTFLDSSLGFAGFFNPNKLKYILIYRWRHDGRFILVFIGTCH